MKYSSGNFDILIITFVCFTSLKIVCPQGIIFFSARDNIHGSNFKYFCIINKKHLIK